MSNRQRSEALRLRVERRLQAFRKAVFCEHDAEVSSERLPADEEVFGRVGEWTMRAIVRYHALNRSSEQDAPPPEGSVLGGVSMRILDDDELRGIDDVFDEGWGRDWWQQRLAKFLTRLQGDPEALATFACLVSEGCQADILAQDFYRAVVPEAPNLQLLEALRQADRLAEHLSRDAKLATDLRLFAATHGLVDIIPTGLAESLDGMAGSISNKEPTGPSDAAISGTRLLAALDHIREVTGKPRHADAALIYNTLRQQAGQDAVEVDSMAVTAKRARRRGRAMQTLLLQVNAKLRLRSDYEEFDFRETLQDVNAE